jgi:hypothetical protein
MKKQLYTTPIFIHYGSVEELTKGTMLGGIPECANGSYCAYRTKHNDNQ